MTDQSLSDRLREVQEAFADIIPKYDYARYQLISLASEWSIAYLEHEHVGEMTLYRKTLSQLPAIIAELEALESTEETKANRLACRVDEVREANALWATIIDLKQELELTRKAEARAYDSGFADGKATVSDDITTAPHFPGGNTRCPSVFATTPLQHFPGEGMGVEEEALLNQLEEIFIADADRCGKYETDSLALRALEFFRPYISPHKEQVSEEIVEENQHASRSEL